MVGLYKTRVALLVLVILSVCCLQRVTHSPTDAASNANDFLEAFSVDRNYDLALSIADDSLRASATSAQLKKTNEEIEGRLGALRTLIADSYRMSPGQGMELFYTGTYEKGDLHFRLVMSGSMASGYRVSGFWFQSAAYPWDDLRRKFDSDIRVQ